MRIIPYVCAEFHDRNRMLLCRIRPSDLRVLRDIPDAVKQDPLFDLLVGDGSIKVIYTSAEERAAEANPGAGIGPDGKNIPGLTDPAPEAAPAAPAPKESKARAKAETKAASEDKPVKA